MSPRTSTGVLKIEVEQRGSATIARLIGSANMVSANHLQDQLLTLVEGRPQRLILDLSGLDFISSVGLGGIIAAHLRCRHHSGTIALAAPTPDILELLRVTNLTKLFSVHESVDAALADLMH
jgi:anti-sigma B factor antagonist